MTKAIQVQGQEQPTRAIDFYNSSLLEQIKANADLMRASGAVPNASAPQIAVMMQAGLEMGLAPVESINAFYFVNGHINLYGKALVKRFRDHGWKIQYKDEVTTKDKEEVTAVVTKDDEEIQEKATFEDAKASGYTMSIKGLKPAWAHGQNRKLKLRYMALSSIAKTYLPDIFGSAQGVVEVAEDERYDAEEKEEIKPIEGEYEEVEKVEVAEKKERAEKSKNELEEAKRTVEAKKSIGDDPKYLKGIHAHAKKYGWEHQDLTDYAESMGLKSIKDWPLGEDYKKLTDHIEANRIERKVEKEKGKNGTGNKSELEKIRSASKEQFGKLMQDFIEAGASNGWTYIFKANWISEKYEVDSPQEMTYAQHREALAHFKDNKAK